MNYSALANKTVKLLTRYGVTTRLIHTTSGTYNVITGSYSSQATSSCNINVLIKSPPKNSNTFIDGTLITSNDKLIMIASGSTLSPELGDMVTIANTNYSIQSIAEFRPASTILYFNALIRR